MLKINPTTHTAKDLIARDIPRHLLQFLQSEYLIACIFKEVRWLEHYEQVDLYHEMDFDRTESMHNQPINQQNKLNSTQSAAAYLLTCSLFFFLIKSQVSMSIEPFEIHTVHVTQ